MATKFTAVGPTANFSITEPNQDFEGQVYGGVEYSERFAKRWTRIENRGNYIPLMAIPFGGTLTLEYVDDQIPTCSECGIDGGYHRDTCSIYAASHGIAPYVLGSELSS